MWLSRQIKPAPPTADADLGMTTIAGDSVGVVTRGEVRALPVYGPGGYVWMPESGSAVLVIKGGPGGEEQCVAGAGRPRCRRECAPARYTSSGRTETPSICGRTAGSSCGARCASRGA